MSQPIFLFLVDNHKHWWQAGVVSASFKGIERERGGKVVNQFSYSPCQKPMGFNVGQSSSIIFLLIDISVVLITSMPSGGDS